MNPRFTLCVLPTEMIEKNGELSWYLKGNDDRYDLGRLGMGDQFELSAQLEGFVSDFKADLEDEEENAMREPRTKLDETEEEQ